MQLNPSEISELLKSRIEGLGASADVRTQGTVVSVTDGITRIHGLSDVMQGEMLEFPNNVFGLALNLERDSVGAVILGDYTGVSEGDAVKTTGRILEVPVGPELKGRVVNTLGEPIDGKGPVNAKATDIIEKWPRRYRPPLGVAAAANRHQGYRLDGSHRPRPARTDHWRPPDRQDRRGRRHHHQPEGQGRHLRVRRHRPEGFDDQQRGAQAGRARRDGIHHRRGRLGSDSAAMQYLAAYAGCTMGEYFRDRGEDALIVYDDLTKQAWAYRRSRCCCAVRRAAKPTRATCSTCTRACWNVPPA